MSSNSSERAWRKFGETTPYFGVLAQDRYRRDSIEEEDIEDFFQSGAEYVQQALAIAHSHAKAPNRFARALDFGCGVGRLTIPLAEFAEEIVGVDISPAMLLEAKSNCESHGITNAEFIDTDALMNESVQSFDLVHTYIVLQHIPPSRGVKILKKLVDLIADNGVGVLHLTYGKAQLGIQWISAVKKWVPFAHNIINVLRGRSFSTPMMQMNDYDLNRVLKILQEAGITDFHAQYSDHGGYLGLSLFFKKPSRIGSQQTTIAA